MHLKSSMTEQELGTYSDFIGVYENALTPEFCYQIIEAFDYHHHTFNTGDLSSEEALKLAVSTWKDIKPAVHYSESKSLHESNTQINPRAHSDYIDNFIDTYGLDVDIMIEAKAKELALLRYRNKFLNNLKKVA